MAKGSGKGGVDDPSVRSIKIFVIALNILTAIAGLSLVGFGIWALFKADLILYSRAIPITMIVSGSFVFLVSFVGCLGSEMESRTALIVYFAILLSLVLVQAITVIYTLANTNKVEDAIDHAWQRAYSRRPKLIRTIEDEFSCCGYRTIYDRAVPDNCSTSPYFGYDVSCFSQLVDAYRSNQGTIAGIGAAIGVVQIIALLAALALARHLPTEFQRDREERQEYERLVARKRTGKVGEEYGSTSRG